MMFQTTRTAAVSAQTGQRRRRQSIRHKHECLVKSHRRRTQPSTFANKQLLQQTLQVLSHLPPPEGLSCIGRSQTAPAILHPRGHRKESRELQG